MLLKVEAYHDGEMWCARGIGEDVFTQGATLDELIANLREAVSLHFEDHETPPEILVFSEVRLAHATVAAG